MNTNVRIQLAAAAALLAVAPVAASADQTAYSAQSPVAIDAVTNQQNFFTIPYYGAQRLYTDGLAVRFTNTGNVAATRVEFAVDRNGAMQRYTARGTYAPGTPVTAELNRDVTEEPQADATVAVSKIDFADGSTWTPAAGRVAATSTLQTAAR